jgi:hypothetical protein
MDLQRSLVRNELASRAFDGLRNQKVMTAMGPEGAGRQTVLFVPICRAGKTFKKKHFLRLTRRREKS